MTANNLAYNREMQYERITKNSPAQIKRRRQLRRNKIILRFLRVLSLIVVAGALVAVFSAMTNYRAQLLELEHAASAISTKIKEAESENTRLVMEIDAMFASNKIDEYAESTLGMKKIERYQIYYLDDFQDDRVIIADGQPVVQLN